MSYSYPSNPRLILSRHPAMQAVYATHHSRSRSRGFRSDSRTRAPASAAHAGSQHHFRGRGKEISPRRLPIGRRTPTFGGPPSGMSQAGHKSGGSPGDVSIPSRRRQRRSGPRAGVEVVQPSGAPPRPLCLACCGTNRRFARPPRLLLDGGGGEDQPAGACQAVQQRIGEQGHTGRATAGHLPGMQHLRARRRRRSSSPG